MRPIYNGSIAYFGDQDVEKLREVRCNAAGAVVSSGGMDEYACVDSPAQGDFLVPTRPPRGKIVRLFTRFGGNKRSPTEVCVAYSGKWETLTTSIHAQSEEPLDLHKSTLLQPCDENLKFWEDEAPHLKRISRLNKRFFCLGNDIPRLMAEATTEAIPGVDPPQTRTMRN